MVKIETLEGNKYKIIQNRSFNSTKYNLILKYILDQDSISTALQLNQISKWSYPKPIVFYDLSKQFYGQKNLLGYYKNENDYCGPIYYSDSFYIEFNTGLQKNLIINSSEKNNNEYFIEILYPDYNSKIISNRVKRALFTFSFKKREIKVLTTKYENYPKQILSKNENEFEKISFEDKCILEHILKRMFAKTRNTTHL